MARRVLILVSGSTSHGGVVLDGADTRTLDGRAIACVGRKVSCPECKGDFPIVPDGSGRRVLPWIGGPYAAVGPGRSASQRFADYPCLVRRQGGAWGANKE